MWREGCGEVVGVGVGGGGGGGGFEEEDWYCGFERGGGGGGGGGVWGHFSMYGEGVKSCEDVRPVEDLLKREHRCFVVCGDEVPEINRRRRVPR